jgi:magnesium transporter
MMKWIELSTVNKENVLKVLTELDVHALTIEDCLNQGQRAKLEEYENHQFLVWFMLAGDHVYELQFIIFPEILILVTHEAPPSDLDWQAYLKIEMARHRDVAHLLYQVLDRATDQTGLELRALSSSIEYFEDEMFQSNVDPRSVLALRKILSKSEFSIGHLPSVVKQIQNFYQFKDDLKWRLRDLHDHCERNKDSIEAQQAHISHAIDLYWGLESNRTNAHIKKLTLLASISIPMTFWASFWGMNFHAIPYESIHFFELAIGVMILSCLSVYLFLRKKGYW